MYAHGPNIGHGFVKYIVIDDHGTEYSPVVFPAMIAPASDTVAGAICDAPVVQVGDAHYWVGDDALLADAPITNLTQQRLTDPVFIPTLLQHGLPQLQHNGSLTGICVTGLPATWARDVEKARDLGARLRSATSCYTTIKVIPEPLGLVYSLLLNSDGQLVGDPTLARGRIGIVDIGHYTVDICVIAALRPLADSLDTSHMGSAIPLKRIRSQMTAHFEREFSLHAIDQMVRTRQINIAGRSRTLPQDWERPLIDHGAAIASWLTEAWGSGSQLDAVLIGGGGAELDLLTEPIRTRFPHAQLVPEPQLAIARGYARLARRLARQEQEVAV
jgi:hypothetical protein